MTSALVRRVQRAEMAEGDHGGTGAARNEFIEQIYNRVRPDYLERHENV